MRFHNFPKAQQQALLLSKTINDINPRQLIDIFLTIYCRIMNQYLNRYYAGMNYLNILWVTISERNISKETVDFHKRLLSISFCNLLAVSNKLRRVTIRQCHKFCLCYFKVQSRGPNHIYIKLICSTKSWRYIFLYMRWVSYTSYNFAVGWFFVILFFT